MATKLTLTPEAQAKVDEMLASEPSEVPGAVPQLPVLPFGRNASLVRLVDGHEARANSFTAQAVAKANRTRDALRLVCACIWRYGLLGAIIKVYYWKVSWHELAYRTVRKYFLDRPVYWTE